AGIANARLRLPGHDGHAAATRAATHQPRDQVHVLARTRRTAPTFGVDAVEPRLRLIPELLRHDGQLGNLLRDPLGLGPLDALAALATRNAHPAKLVPAEPSDVSLVLNHGPDGGVAPSTAVLVAPPAVVGSDEALLVE